MHPSPYIVTGSGYKRHFGHYPETNYHPFEVNSYATLNGKYSQSWVGWSTMPTNIPIEPHSHDVLLGRGGRNNQHSGNDILRQFGRLQGENYRVASKKGKSAISRLLVSQMRELNPPARFLKRVAQTASWEEVSEETAREKASQVLRDAVAGLLEKKCGNEDMASLNPLPALSAPVSVDEHDLSPHYKSSRHETHYVCPPQSIRLESERKRQRYNTELSEDMQSSSRQKVVGCSPLRRHAELSYSIAVAVDSTHAHSWENRSDTHSRTVTAQVAENHHLSGNLDEFALLHGDLLESDAEEEASNYRERHTKRL